MIKNLQNINKSIPILSIETDKQLKNTNNLVEQQTINIQKHKVDKVYKILTDNRKNWNCAINTIFSPGYFNNHTNFLVGNKNSLLIINENLKYLTGEENTIDNLLNRQQNTKDFLIYPIPCFNLKTNDYIHSIIENRTYTINLTFDLGYNMGNYLSLGKFNKDISKQDSLFIKKSIKINKIKNKITNTIIKELIINSNPLFVVGILSGYLKTIKNKYAIIKDNINIYTITTILNYLGASYSIRNYNDKFYIYFQLEYFFKDYLPSKYIKKTKYIIKDNKIKLIEIKDNKIDYTVNYIPIDSLYFKEEINNKILYDMVTQFDQATNYGFGLTPLLKNSDGDILGVQGIFTKQALNDAKKFSPESKDYYKSLNDGNIQNWIADDAILGLYEATKK